MFVQLLCQYETLGITIGYVVKLKLCIGAMPWEGSLVVTHALKYIHVYSYNSIVSKSVGWM